MIQLITHTNQKIVVTLQAETELHVAPQKPLGLLLRYSKTHNTHDNIHKVSEEPSTSSFVTTGHFTTPC